MQHKHLFDIPKKEQSDQSTVHEAYQADLSDSIAYDIDTNIDEQPLVRVDAEPDVVEHVESTRDNDINFINDSSESEMSDTESVNVEDDIDSDLQTIV